MDTMMTRRQACALGAVAMGSAALWLAGCSSGEASSSGSGNSGAATGFSSDTESPEGNAVALSFYVDQDLSYYPANDGSANDRLTYLLGKYQQQSGRGQVDAGFTYLPSSQLAEMAQGGFGDGDGLICTSSVMDAAIAASLIDAGAGNTSVRQLNYSFSPATHLVRARGSAVDLPAAKTVDGKDAPDGSVTRLDGIGEAGAMIAIADPNVEPVGVSANKLLYGAGLYTGDDGLSGSYDASIADLVVVCADQDDAMSRVANGECGFGFAFTAGLAGRYPGVEDFYTPSGASNVVYQGGAFASSQNAGVAKDFLQYLTMVSG